MFEEQFQTLSKLAARSVPAGLTCHEYLCLGIGYCRQGWIAQAREALSLAAKSPDQDISTRAMVYLKTKVPKNPVPVGAEAANIRGHNLIAEGDLEEAKRELEPLLK